MSIISMGRLQALNAAACGAREGGNAGRSSPARFTRGGVVNI